MQGVGVVAVEERFDVEARRGSGTGGRAIGPGTGRVGRTIDAIRSKAGHHDGPRGVRERPDGPGHELLIPPTPPLAPDSDGRLSRSDHAHGPRERLRHVEDPLHERRARDARLAFDGRVEHDRVQPEFERPHLGARHPRTPRADQLIRRASEHGVARLWRLGQLSPYAPRQMFTHGRGYRRGVLHAVHDAQGLREGAGIGHGGARPDDAGVILHRTDDVGDGQGDDPSATCRREASALDAREVLADGIEFADGTTVVHQPPRSPLLVVERQAVRGQTEQRRSASRQEHDELPVRRHAPGQRQCCLRRLDARGRGCRVSTFEPVDAGWHTVSLMRAHGHRLSRFGGCMGVPRLDHGRGGLAGRNERVGTGAVDWRHARGQRAAEQCRGAHRVERSARDAQQVGGKGERRGQWNRPSAQGRRAATAAKC